jgi:hypothetical protein
MVDSWMLSEPSGAWIVLMMLLQSAVSLCMGQRFWLSRLALTWSGSMVLMLAEKACSMAFIVLVVSLSSFE